MSTECLISDKYLQVINVVLFWLLSFAIFELNWEKAKMISCKHLKKVWKVKLISDFSFQTQLIELRPY